MTTFSFAIGVTIRNKQLASKVNQMDLHRVGITVGVVNLSIKTRLYLLISALLFICNYVGNTLSYRRMDLARLPATHIWGLLCAMDAIQSRGHPRFISPLRHLPSPKVWYLFIRSTWEFSFPGSIRSLRDDDCICGRSMSQVFCSEILCGGCLWVVPYAFMYIFTIVSRAGNLGINHPRSSRQVEARQSFWWWVHWTQLHGQCRSPLIPLC